MLMLLIGMHIHLFCTHLHVDFVTCKRAQYGYDVNTPEFKAWAAQQQQQQQQEQYYAQQGVAGYTPGATDMSAPAPPAEQPPPPPPA
jgi:hypothetical protein